MTDGASQFGLPPGSLPGVIPIQEPETGFVAWNLSYSILERRLREETGTLVEIILAGGVSGVTLELDSVVVPTAERTEALMVFVDELQLRGVSVLLVRPSADFVTAIEMDGAGPRLATRPDLCTALGLLREYDGMRRQCTSSCGRRINQLRMPAFPASLAPLCDFVRDRLTQAAVCGEALADMLHDTYFTLADVCAESFAPGEGEIAVSVTVHEGRATVTLLDGGRPRTERARDRCVRDRVDRIHTFRILDRHNATVLEKDGVGVGGTR